VQKKHAARFFKWEQKMKVSARNQLKGKIAEVTKGATTSHVLIEIGSGVVVTASITNEAVADLQLKKGDDAWAVIKASDVIREVRPLPGRSFLTTTIDSNASAAA